MPRPSPTTDPELKAHREWLGYLQPVGLVVAPAAMLEAGWVVTRSGSVLIERQERYREALEPLSPPNDTDDSDTAAGENAPRGFRSLAELLTDHLGWDPEQLDTSPEAIAAHTKELPELGETLKPTAVVPAAAGEGAQLLVIELPPAAAFDQKTTDGEHLWRASAQERLERLLRETGMEAGLLFNGRQLRLVVAPKGESSGHLTFTLSELAEVSGRLMLSGLDLLLGQSHVFLDPDGTRLADVLRKSRSFQAVVSNALADQVLAALWDLLRGFQQADELAQRQDDALLGDLPERDPQQLYGGLITVLMRLVFLLYAEDEALMPADAVYELNYKVSGVYEQLQRDEAEYPDTMEQRYGAWAGLMSLCRLVFDGGGPSVNYLPARKGQLFNPAEYPWLETPWISDGVVLAVLRNLLIVNGERISYRALDVEQIGSVYEGIMGYAVRRIPGRCIGLKSKPQGAKKQITTAVDLDALLALPGGKRKAWLEEEAGTTLPTKAANALKAAGTEAELLEALAPRIDRNLFDGPQAAGSLVFQPTEERRRRQPLHPPLAHPPDRGGGAAPLAGALRRQTHRGPDPGARDLRSSHGLGRVSGGVLPLSGRIAGAGLGPRRSTGRPQARRLSPRRRAPDLRPPTNRPELPVWGGQEPVCGEPGPPQPLASEPQQGRAVHVCGSRPEVRRFAGGHGAQRHRSGLEGRQPAA
jgi:hypothetical protein